MLSKAERARRKREQLLRTTRKYSVGTYQTRFVAPIFQRMIRAEAAALPAGLVPAIVDGEVVYVYRDVGQCVCVTCGKLGRWASGLGGMHTGHFLASRKNAILYEEDNVAPQCSNCNRYEGGEPQKFRQWMLAVRGKETVERLERLKRTTVSFAKEELVDMRIDFHRRLKDAEAKLGEARLRY